MAKGTTDGEVRRGRGRPPKNKGLEMSDPNSSAASVRTNGGPSDSDIQEWLTEMTEIETAMARLRQKSSTLKKSVENAAGDWKGLKSAFASTKLSKAEATEKLEKVARYHRAIGIRIAWDSQGQSGLVDILADPPQSAPSDTEQKLAVARAHGGGYNDGRLGAPASSNPFNPGTEEYVAWLKGHDDGDLDRTLKTATDMSKAAKSPEETPAEPITF